jgi:hypothetical protein
MSMMDLQGALGGPPGGGPPSIAVAGGPPDAAPPDAGGGAGSSIDFLDDAEEALNQFIQVDPDEVDRAKASKALQIVLDLKAANQTDTQQGGMKSLQRALAGAGGAPGGAPPLG